MNLIGAEDRPEWRDKLVVNECWCRDFGTGHGDDDGTPRNRLIRLQRSTAGIVDPVLSTWLW